MDVVELKRRLGTGVMAAGFLKWAQGWELVDGCLVPKGTEKGIVRVTASFATLPHHERIRAWADLFTTLGVRLPHREVLGLLTVAGVAAQRVELEMRPGPEHRITLLLPDLAPDMLEELQVLTRTRVAGQGAGVELMYGSSGFEVRRV